MNFGQFAAWQSGQVSVSIAITGIELTGFFNLDMYEQLLLKSALTILTLSLSSRPHTFISFVHLTSLAVFAWVTLIVRCLH